MPLGGAGHGEHARRVTPERGSVEHTPRSPSAHSAPGLQGAQDPSARSTVPARHTCVHVSCTHRRPAIIAEAHGRHTGRARRSGGVAHCEEGYAPSAHAASGTQGRHAAPCGS